MIEESEEEQEEQEEQDAAIDELLAGDYCPTNKDNFGEAMANISTEELIKLLDAFLLATKTGDNAPLGRIFVSVMTDYWVKCATRKVLGSLPAGVSRKISP